MKRKTTLSSAGRWAGVKITIEMNSRTGCPRRDVERAMDSMTDACAKAICDAPMTGVEYAHQIKIR